MTYADLFSHVSGLPGHAGDLLEDLGYDQAYILNRLRLEPLGPFRAQYEYTNFGLTAAAEAAAAAKGMAWADLADEVLFGPLDMSATSFRYSDFLAETDTAAMHIRVGDKWIQKYSRDADPEAPAGGASSNVLDLANWLILLLANGTFNGTPVIGADALSEAHLPHALSGLPMSVISRSGFYGYGTNVGYDYAGRLRLSHSGGFNQGAATAFSLLPSADLGIVVLTNGMPIGVPEAINNYFLDWVEAGSVQDDWLALYEKGFANFYVNPSELAGKKPPKHPVPAKPDSFYTGTYDNPYYGPIKIVAEGKTLHLLIGPASAPNDYPLGHWSGNLFSFYPTGENAVGITAATFHPNARDTRAASVTLEYYNTNGLGPSPGRNPGWATSVRRASAAKARTREGRPDPGPGRYADDAVRGALASVQPDGRCWRPVGRAASPALVAEVGDPAGRKDPDQRRDRGDGPQPVLPMADEGADRDDDGGLDEEDGKRGVPGAGLEVLRDR